jgi:TonB family protein
MNAEAQQLASVFFSIVLMGATSLANSAWAQRVPSPMPLPTVEPGTCNLALRPSNPVPGTPSFLVISYAPATASKAFDAQVMASSGDARFDRLVVERLQTCLFRSNGAPATEARGLILFPVAPNLGISPAELPASSPLPPCTRTSDYPSRAFREGRGGTVGVKIFGTDGGHLAHIELSLSSGHVDIDEAVLSNVANCQRSGAKPGSSGVTMVLSAR